MKAFFALIRRAMQLTAPVWECMDLDWLELYDSIPGIGPARVTVELTVTCPGEQNFGGFQKPCLEPHDSRFRGPICGVLYTFLTLAD